MIGKRFTRIDAIGSKLSKLDMFWIFMINLTTFRFRFLIEGGLVIVLFSCMCLWWIMVLRLSKILIFDGFNDMVKDVVKEFVVDRTWSKFVVLKNKLKFLKNRIRNWVVAYKEASRASSN
uniref:Uncharacterized protein n=1 Tax=Lactuca sativa TaxID=4236 RepID=A0A9R1UC68_LACSA|nr:hypothetical protein LSAT_V11C900462880 [Lactuca sativa]